MRSLTKLQVPFKFHEKLLKKSIFKNKKIPITVKGCWNGNWSLEYKKKHLQITAIEILGKTILSIAIYIYNYSSEDDNDEKDSKEWKCFIILKSSSSGEVKILKDEDSESMHTGATYVRWKAVEIYSM